MWIRFVGWSERTQNLFLYRASITFYYDIGENYVVCRSVSIKLFKAQRPDQILRLRNLRVKVCLGRSIQIESYTFCPSISLPFK